MLVGLQRNVKLEKTEDGDEKNMFCSAAERKRKQTNTLGQEVSECKISVKHGKSLSAE